METVQEGETKGVGASRRRRKTNSKTSSIALKMRTMNELSVRRSYDGYMASVPNPTRPQYPRQDKICHYNIYIIKYFLI